MILAQERAGFLYTVSMQNVILITGIAASGKTTVCQELRRRGYKAVDIERIDGMFSKIVRATGKPYVGPNKNSLEVVKKTDWICHKERLVTFIKQQRDVTFCGGVAANLEDLIPLFQTIILLTAERDTIKKRLHERTGTGFGKDPEVRDAILDEIDVFNKAVKAHEPMVVSSDRSLEETVDDLLRRLNLPSRADAL